MYEGEGGGGSGIGEGGRGEGRRNPIGCFPNDFSQVRQAK